VGAGSGAAAFFSAGLRERAGGAAAACAALAALTPTVLRTGGSWAAARPMPGFCPQVRPRRCFPLLLYSAHAAPLPPARLRLATPFGLKTAPASRR
jgi:hypothetical protein